MNAFMDAAADARQRLARSDAAELVARIAARADAFQAKVEMAAKDYSRYTEYDYGQVLDPADAVALEVRDTIGKAMVRLDAEDRESLVYWLIQEVAARAAIERMAAERRAASGRR